MKSISFEYFRNLKDFPYPIRSSEEDREKIIMKISLLLNTLEKENLIEAFTFIRKSDNPEEFNNIKCTSKNKVGLFKSTTNNGEKLLILVNDETHLRIISKTNNYQNITNAYERLVNFTKLLDTHLNFDFDNSYGYLNSDVSLLGSSLVTQMEIQMKKLLKYSTETFEEIRKIFNTTNKLNGIFSIYLKKTFLEEENEFLEKIFNIFYNLHFIEENLNTCKIENISNEIDKMQQEALTDKEKKFYECLKFAYEWSYPVYQYTHLYPENITLNKLIKDISSNSHGLLYFKLYPSFYNFFLVSYKGLNYEVAKKTVYSKARKCLTDINVATKIIDKIPLNKIKRLNLTIRRNINFGTETEDVTKKTFNLLSQVVNNLDESCEWEEATQTFYFQNKKIAIHLNMSDNLTLSLNFSHIENNLSNLIEIFIKLYFTTDVAYLGTGISYLVEFESKNKISSEAIKEEGFYVENLEKSTILGCNLNVNSTIYKIFKVTFDLI